MVLWKDCVLSGCIECCDSFLLLTADVVNRAGRAHIGSFELWSCLNRGMGRTGSNQVTDGFLCVSGVCLLEYAFSSQLVHLYIESAP